MKSTTHFVVVNGRQVRVKLAQNGWLTVKVLSWATGRFTRRLGHGYTITTYRARTLWQLQRQINGLSTGAHP